LQLLQIPRGILVLTKCDQAEQDWIDIVEEEVRDTFSGTFLSDAPCCRVSAIRGEGLIELKQTIQCILNELPPRDEEGPTRVPIDRHFTISGFGTVLTGTLLSGQIKVGDTVEVLPPGETVRVREIQVHGQKSESARAGQRVALNLAGMERSDLIRGAVVATPGFFVQTERFDARLNLLKDAHKPLKFRDPVHLHMGTARVTGKIILLDRDDMQPGQSLLVQILLDSPLVVHRQDRFIVRSYSPMRTIGGGQVLDPSPAKHKRYRKEVMEALKELESGEGSFIVQKLSELGCAKLKEIEQASGLGREKVTSLLEQLSHDGQVLRLGDQWLTAETARSWQRVLVETIESYHGDYPLHPGIPHATLKGSLPSKVAPKAFEELLIELLQTGEWTQKQEWISRSTFVPQPTSEQKQFLDRLENVYRQAGAAAKGRIDMINQAQVPDHQVDSLLAYLFANRLLIRLNDDSFLHQDAYQQALGMLIQHFSVKETLTLAEFRDLIGSARKQTQAILEYFDSLKYTMRRGDERVAWQLPEK
jgi:selenocysteine-specific elongation factor